MRLPKSPKPLAVIMRKINGGRWTEVMERAPILQRQDNYWHWDELRHRPIPEGLSLEEWWLALKLGRQAKGKTLPLCDKQGQNFQFCVPDLLAEQLHRIDRGLGLNITLPDSVGKDATRDEYIVNSLFQEAITSSQLEGAATTREVAREMLRTGRPPRDRSERMVLNNYLSMRHIMAVREEPLTPALVFGLHRHVTEATLDRPDAAGRFRRGDELIRVVDAITGEVFHEPPSFLELPDRMKAMCDFANGRTPDYFIHPVIRAIILHFWLAYDHPFVDGNGRTARALFYWSMLHANFRLFEYISISEIILGAPIQYYMAFLKTETDDNDLTYFILHQAGVIHRAVDQLNRYVATKTAQVKELQQCLRGVDTLNHRQAALLAHALRDPGARYTIEGHRNSHDIVYQTARTDLLTLEKRGLLTLAEKKGRNFIFRPPSDLGDRLKQLASAADPDGTNDSTLPLPLTPGNPPTG